MEIESHDLRPKSGEIAPEVIDRIRGFYQGATRCVQEWKKVNALSKVYQSGEVIDNYLKSLYRVSANYDALIGELSEMKDRPDSGSLLKQRIRLVMDEIDKVRAVLHRNHYAVSAKLESLEQRRAAQGFVKKNLGRAARLRDKGVGLVKSVAAGGYKRARSIGSKVLVKGVRAFVPRRVRKGGAWLYDRVRDAEDFWREAVE